MKVKISTACNLSLQGHKVALASREAELPRLSRVRNNAQGARAWGFMIELERLTVMFSRARFRQVVVGCGDHVVRHAEEAPHLAAVWSEYRLAEARGSARVLSPEDLPRG